MWNNGHFSGRDYMSNTLSNAFKLLSITTFIGAAFCFGAFLFRSMYGFLALFSIGELLVFATQVVSFYSINISLCLIAILKYYPFYMLIIYEYFSNSDIVKLNSWLMIMFLSKITSMFGKLDENLLSEN